jgi:hypothetical protein
MESRKKSAAPSLDEINIVAKLVQMMAEVSMQGSIRTLRNITLKPEIQNTPISKQRNREAAVS